MSRAEHRAAIRRTPPKLRGVPVVSITAADAAKYFPPSFTDGTVCTIKGLSYRMDKGQRVVTRCASGEEKPFKLEIRKAAAAPPEAPDAANELKVLERPGRTPLVRITQEALNKVPNMTRDGDYATFKGVCYRYGKFSDCEPGKETRFKLELRA